MNVGRLDYNELKRILLRVLEETGPADSSSLLRNLSSAGSGKFEIHAVRMALMRYYRQGLVKRIRTGGQFKYTLSIRGTARLRWLETQVKDSRRSRNSASSTPKEMPP
jgi:DNA-binding transcriptional regulator PaaX